MLRTFPIKKYCFENNYVLLGTSTAATNTTKGKVAVAAEKNRVEKKLVVGPIEVLLQRKHTHHKERDDTQARTTELHHTILTSPHPLTELLRDGAIGKFSFNDNLPMKYIVTSSCPLQRESCTETEDNCCRSAALLLNVFNYVYALAFTFS